MSEITRRSGALRAFAGLAAALGARSLAAQSPTDLPPAAESGPVVLPNGKKQSDEILKSDYNQNLKDARELTSMAKAFELDLEKSDRFVLSLGLLKKLDDIEKLTKRIRGRMRR